MRPIQLYLDSSDYSNFASRPDETSEILAYLRNALSCGLIEIRYSPIHISEATQTKPQYSSIAIQRARIIEELSTGNCVLEPFFIWEKEAVCKTSLSLGERVPQIRKMIFRNDNVWFSTALNDLSPPDIKTLVQKAIEQAQQENPHLPRRERRKRKAEIFKKGKLTPFTKKLLIANADSTDWGPLLPSEIKEKRLFQRWVSGDLAGEEFMCLFMKEIIRPKAFIYLTATKGEYTETLKGLANHLMPVLTDAYTKFDDITQQFADLRKTLIELGLRSDYEWLDINFLKQQDRIKRKIVEKIANKHAFDLSAAQPAPDMPSLDFMIHVAMNHFQSLVSTYKTGAIPKRARQPNSFGSDSGDILHIAYAPYFDLFRCDSYFADICRKSGANISDHIIARLKDLPDAIERKLRQQAQ